MMSKDSARTLFRGSILEPMGTLASKQNCILNGYFQGEIPGSGAVGRNTDPINNNCSDVEGNREGSDSGQSTHD